jgi:flagellar basal-body rod protein FlgG
MRIGIYTAAIGSQEQQKRLEVISNNIANSGTIGFKKDMVCFQDFLVQTTAPRLDQGPIRANGNPLDIALSGKGFLSARSDVGIVYTRNGNLTMDRNGMLTTQEGWPILGKNGPIRLTSSTPLIDAEGRIYEGDSVVDTLDLVELPAGSAPQKFGNGYLKLAAAAPSPVPARNCSVQQGATEGANFNVVEEMVQMIDTMRIFEAHQKVLRSFEQIDSQLTNKFASV